MLSLDELREKLHQLLPDALCAIYNQALRYPEPCPGPDMLTTKERVGMILLEREDLPSELLFLMLPYKSLSVKAAQRMVKLDTACYYELRTAIFYNQLHPVRFEAARALRERAGIFVELDEEKDMLAIARKVNECPTRLQMNTWHSDCGTAHCIAGWECVLNQDAHRLELDTSTETAATAFLPSYSHLFYRNNKVAMDYLQYMLRLDREKAKMKATLERATIQAPLVVDF